MRIIIDNKSLGIYDTVDDCITVYIEAKRKDIKESVNHHNLLMFSFRKRQLTQYLKQFTNYVLLQYKGW